MKLFLPIKATLLLLLICGVTDVYAQWSTTATTDNDLHYTTYGGRASFCSDGHGGVIYTWYGQVNNGNTIQANRIDSLGYIRWGNNGVTVNANTGGYTSPVICEDGKGGAYIAYGVSNVAKNPLFCQRIDSNGTSLWDSIGIQPFAFTQSYQLDQTSPALVNDAGKGVFVVGIIGVLGGSAEVACQRFNLTGQKQWLYSGVLIDTVWDERTPQVIADGNNGIALIWFELTYGGRNLKMQRLNHDGIPQFTGGIKYLHSPAPDDSYTQYKIIRTTKNNFIATWIGSFSGGGSSFPQIYTQKINGSGASLWPGNSIPICDTLSNKDYFDLMSDGKDGAYYIWSDGRKVNIADGAYAQHLDSTGTLKWQKNGIQLDSVISNISNVVSLAPDVNNGFKAFYIDESTSSNQTYMQVVNSSGVKQLPNIGKAVSAYGHPIYDNLPVSNNHTILMLSYGFAKYVPFAGILPVTFINFTAQAKDETNQLSWQTATEINTKYFSVERSNTGVAFNEIGQVAAGNNGGIYTYNDGAVTTTDAFYRLKCVDADGVFTYSKIVTIHRGVIADMHVVPNPARNNCTVYFERTIDAKGIITLYALDGKLQKQQTLAVGQNQALLDVSGLSAGSYFVSLLANGKMTVQKIVVIK